MQTQYNWNKNSLKYKNKLQNIFIVNNKHKWGRYKKKYIYILETKNNEQQRANFIYQYRINIFFNFNITFKNSV